MSDIENIEVEDIAEKLQDETLENVEVSDGDHLDDANAAPEVEIVFPVHPRTQKMLALINHLPNNVKLLGPQPYLEFVWLIKNSVVVVTDSGGILSLIHI